MPKTNFGRRAFGEPSGDPSACSDTSTVLGHTASVLPHSQNAGPLFPLRIWTARSTRVTNFSVAGTARGRVAANGLDDQVDRAFRHNGLKLSDFRFTQSRLTSRFESAFGRPKDQATHQRPGLTAGGILTDWMRSASFRKASRATAWLFLVWVTVDLGYPSVCMLDQGGAITVSMKSAVAAPSDDPGPPAVARIDDCFCCAHSVQITAIAQPTFLACRQVFATVRRVALPSVTGSPLYHPPRPRTDLA